MELLSFTIIESLEFTKLWNRCHSQNYKVVVVTNCKIVIPNFCEVVVYKVLEIRFANEHLQYIITSINLSLNI